MKVHDPMTAATASAIRCPGVSSATVGGLIDILKPT
jgi:hypothetical protein